MKRLFVAALAALGLCTTSALASTYSAHYVFGDSLSDSGNLYLATGGALPQAGDYWNGHFSDGQVFAEMLSSSLGLSAAPSYAGGTNYAVGGAMTDAHILNTPQANAAFSLQGQIATYFASNAAADPNALFTVWVGSNDVFTALELAAGGDVAGAGQRLSTSVNDIAVALGQLIGAGARNILLPNITDLGLTPRIVGFGPQAQGLASALVQNFNAAVDQVAAQYSGAVAGLNFVRFDTYGLLGDVISNPGGYGFSADLSPCIDGSIGVPSTTQCDNPSDRVFWDDIHPSSATHQILATAMLAALQPVPVPASLLLLCLALIALWTVRNARFTRPKTHTAAQH